MYFKYVILICKTFYTRLVLRHQSSFLIFKHGNIFLIMPIMRIKLNTLWKFHFYNNTRTAAFQKMCVLPAKHSVWLHVPRKVWLPDRTDGQIDRQTPDNVIPMCRYALQARQKLNKYNVIDYPLESTKPSCIGMTAVKLVIPGKCICRHNY